MNTLAVFSGIRLMRDPAGVSCNEAFIHFIDGFAEHYGRATMLARVEPRPERGPYALDPIRLEVAPLPFFSQFRVGSLTRLLPQVRRTLRTQVEQHRLVWVGGPHLLAELVVRECQRAGTPCFLVVRQNLVGQMRHRAPGLRKPMAVAAAWLLERRFRRLARKHVTFTVGRAMYKAYGGENRDNVHEIAVNLLRDRDIPASVERRPAANGCRMLFVGRLSPEKGIPVLLRAMAQLAFEDPPSLVIVGTGPQREKLERMARTLGVADRTEFAGYVPFGRPLARFYDQADLCVLPSLTGEGLPQVLLEAMAASLPCIASSVEGIPYFVEHERDALLVAPGSVQSLTLAIRRLQRDRELRLRLAEGGLIKVRQSSLEQICNRMQSAIASRFDAATLLPAP